MSFKASICNNANYKNNKADVGPFMNKKLKS